MNKTSNNIWNIAKQLCTFVQQKEREFPDAESQTRVWQAIQTEIIRKKRRRRVFLYSSIAVASSVLLLLTFPNIIWKSQEKDPLLSYVEQLKQRKATFNGQKEIILELGKNNIVTVQSDDSIMHSSNGDVYVNQRTMNQANELTSKTENSEEIYNQLSVPLGKRIKLRLSDGTNLWVNSGTRVVYPITFKQRRREIFVDGEVYLDVAHDTERPFLVRTNQCSVTVLGTSFNLSAYDKDEETTVVLVKGKVQVTDEMKQVVQMLPDQLIHVVNGIAHHLQDVDVSKYIGWTQDLLDIDNEPLETTFKKLHRYYGKEFIFSPQVGALITSGQLELKKNIHEIMQTICFSLPLSYYESENKICIEYQEK